MYQQRVKYAPIAALALLLVAPVHGASSAAAQVPDAATPSDSGGWNAPRALDLIARARARRLLPQQDTMLRNYTARAEGFVYFYLDRRDSDERTLVKVDQVALELYWTPPSRTSQRIVGLRDESRLPNRMHYHLDHLTVVQNGFGDVIRMGDGDEVSDVPHPAAPGSDSIYEFRLADSLTLQLPNAVQPIRVYQIEVRPLRVDRPALVGSVFVEQASADIVRMNFTFTPVSYVDRRLDYIAVSLDNGLWEGRYWLPNEQTLQIRRQIPELDFAAGAVIQGRMRIHDYTFNDSTRTGTARIGVSAVPPDQRETFAFESGIYDDLNDAGLSPPPDLATIRQEAAKLLGTQRLSGLPRLRLGIGSVSSALRYNRAEGPVIGAGFAYAPDPRLRADVAGGYAFGPDRPWARATGTRKAGTVTASLDVSYRNARDLGPGPVLPGAVNTLSSLFLGRDYTDLYYATGARLRLGRALGRRLRGEVELVGERHASAELTQADAPFSGGDEFRPVRAIDPGDFSAMVLTLRRPAPDPRADDWSARIDIEAGAFDGNYHLRPSMQAGVRRSSGDHSRDITLAVSAGLVTENAPSQRLFLLGGAGTLPGYAFRSFAGRRFALLDAQASVDVARPWLRLRAVGSVGAVGGLPDAGTPPVDAGPGDAWRTWGVTGTDRVRASIGAGVSLLWDVVRIDAVRGVNGGDWGFVLSFHPGLLDVS